MMFHDNELESKMIKLLKYLHWFMMNYHIEFIFPFQLSSWSNKLVICNQMVYAQNTTLCSLRAYLFVLLLYIVTKYNLPRMQ